MASELKSFTDVLDDPEEIICDSQPLSLSFVDDSQHHVHGNNSAGDVVANSDIVCNFGSPNVRRPAKGTGQYGEFRSADEIDVKYRSVFSYPFFNLVQSRVIEDALYSDKSMVVCAPTGSGKTVVFEMAIVQLLMQLEDRNENRDFKIIYMAPVKALCMERLTEWYAKFTKLGLQCIAVTGDTDVDFLQLKPYRIIITTPEKWDMLTRRWRDHRQMVEVIKLFLIDEVHILNDETRGPVLEAVVSRMKTIEASVQSTHRLEQLQQQYQGAEATRNVSPNIRFVAVSATVSNPEDVAAWLETNDKPAVYYKFGDECRPVRLRRVVEGYHCAENTSIFKFDLVLNYKLWPIIQKYHNGKPTLIFCNTRKSVALTAETLAREITICFNEAQKERLMAIASTIKNKKLQTLVLSGVGCHHAGLLYEERTNIELAFRNRDLPILITTTTLAMGVNLPAHLVIIKNTQQYVGGAYQEYSISTVLQMVGRAGRPQFDTEATAVIMTRMADKPRYQALVGGSEPLQSYLHKRVPENLNSEAALGTVSDVAQCVQWLRSTFLFVRAAKDPKRYLGLPQSAPNHQISKKIEELCVKAMNSLASSGLITMDEACCIESTEAGRLMSIYYLDLETMKHIMKINGSESLERLLWMVCECHELCDMYLRMDERRCLNTLNRNNAAATIRFPMKGKITTRQMKLNCMIQAVLGCLPIPDPALNQEAMKIMRIADRVCKCLVAYVTRPALVSQQPQYYSAILNTIILAKCVAANLWENSPYVSKQLKGIGPAFSTLLATAGKVNFMLLEESHPRDLERIMNKGPPAGNILRKQINLLPKYQLTMTPVDEKVVSTELVLLNHHNLSGNLDNLTAGTKHKSYVIIGDSENILLLLTSFTDKDLIGVYDGSITYQITRKHGFEHKIYAHCVSSTFAGLDAYCEYVFKDVEPQIKPTQSQYNEELTKKTVQKQTTITNTFRERKRNNTDNQISQSKEKKKRESAFIDNFKNLKESFGKTSKVLKEDLEKSTVMSEHILRELTHLKQPDTPSIVHTANVPVEPNYHRNEEPPVKSAFFAEPNTYEINDNDLNDEFLDEDQINNILNEIESEISKVNSKPELSNKTKLYSSNENECIIQKAAMSRPVNTKCVPNRNTSYLESINKKRYKPVSKNVPKKTNFSFIDLLEKNVDLSDDEETKAHEQNSFSDTIRGHIDKYLHKAKTNIKVPDIILPGIIQDEPISTKGTFIVQGSSRNKDDYNATINEIMLEDNTDSDKEKPTTDVDENYEENELPAIKLLNRDIRDDTDTGNAEEKKERRIITDYNNVEDNITSNKNIEPEKPINLINESKNTENICVYNTNDERELKKLEPVLGKDVSPLVPLIGTNIKDLDSDNMNIATAVDNKCSIVIPSSTKIKGKQGHEIQPPRQVEIKPRNNENIEIIEFSNLAATAFGIQSVSRQLNCKDILPIAVPRPIRHVPEVKEKQEFPMIDMWKKYIKELPSLELGKNNNEVTASNNTMSYDFDEPQTFTQRNDDSNKLPVALPTTIIHVPEVTENLSAIELPKNNKCIYIPPSKYHQFGATENLPPSIQNSNDKPSTLPSILDIKENQRLEIETPKNNKDIREITQTSAFDNHLVFTQQSYNSATNKELQNTHYHDPTTTEEIQSLLQTDPPRNSGKENKDITTFSFASSQPISTQHNYNFKLPFVLSNTVTRVPDLQQKQELPATELRKSTVQRLKDLTLFNNSNSFEFSNKAHLQNCNNDEIFLPKMASYTPESDETQRLEIKSPSTKDIPTYNNSTTYAIGNRPAFAEESNDYNYPRADKRTQYINRYSYSTNKTDVSTQEIADHVVRVTRKLILNLDVTEIVSNENKTMRKEEQVDDKNKNSEAFKKQKLESAQNIDHCKNVNAMVASYSSGFGNINVTGNPKELPNSDYLTAPQICPENQYLLPLPFMHFHAPSIEHCKNENARVASYSSGVGNINVTGNPKALSSSDDLSVAQKCPENQYLLPLPFMHFQAPNIEHCKNENARVASYSSGVGNINVTGNPKALSSSDDLSAAQKCPENQCLLPLPSTTATKLLRSSPIVEFSEDNIELKEVGKDNEGVKNTFSEYKIADSPEENKPDSVQSILQKFIKNMGNNSSRNAVLPDSSNQRLVQSKASERTLNAAENYKPKILFKKSDIRRLSHTSLPSALMTKPKTVNVNERFTLLQTNNKLDLLEQNRQIKNYEIGISTPKKPVFNQDYNEDTQEHVLQNTCNIEDEDIPDYDQSIEDLEVKDTVSNIDPTMFNPKTLLQCYNNDEPDDIIPPPPEFSDFFNTTSDYINADTNSMDCYDPTAWEEDKYVSREGIPNRSIFQDYSQVELTPSKEIERWSLSEDEGNCKMYSSPGASPYSFTIKRENKLPTTQNAPHNSLPKNETLSRLNKLKQFKYNPKNMLKF